MTKSFKYKAFISYSHQDKKWGDWLHKKLEAYRVPKELVGKQTGVGVVPKRLFPIFRDREELPTSHELGRVINKALRDSSHLVVICSPRSAKSLWVNEEIKEFKKLGKRDNILCMIVDGEPNSGDKPGMEKDECFPEAAKYEIGENGELTDKRTEPIAADAREGKDGKRNALLKLIAGLINVGFDNLKQRDLARRQKRMVVLSTVSLALFAIMAGLTFWALDQQQKAKLSQVLANQEKIKAITANEKLKNEIYKNEVINIQSVLKQASELMDEGNFINSQEVLYSIPEKLRNWEWKFFAHELNSKFKNGHKSKILNAEFSPDGSMAYSQSEKTVKIWSAYTEQNTFTAEHAHPVEFVQFSIDSTLVLTLSGGRIRVYDIKNGILISTIGDKDLTVYSASFSDDGSKIVITNGPNINGNMPMSGFSSVWDVKNGKHLLSLKSKGPHYPEFGRFLSEDRLIITTSRKRKLSRESEHKHFEDIRKTKKRMIDSGTSEEKIEELCKIKIQNADFVLWNAKTGNQIKSLAKKQTTQNPAFEKNDKNPFGYSKGPSPPSIKNDQIRRPLLEQTNDRNTEIIFNKKTQISDDEQQIVKLIYDRTLLVVASREKKTLEDYFTFLAEEEKKIIKRKKFFEENKKNGPKLNDDEKTWLEKIKSDYLNTKKKFEKLRSTAQLINSKNNENELEIVNVEIFRTNMLKRIFSHTFFPNNNNKIEEEISFGDKSDPMILPNLKLSYAPQILASLDIAYPDDGRRKPILMSSNSKYPLSGGINSAKTFNPLYFILPKFSTHKSDALQYTQARKYISGTEFKFGLIDSNNHILISKSSSINAPLLINNNLENPIKKPVLSDGLPPLPPLSGSRDQSKKTVQVTIPTIDLNLKTKPTDLKNSNLFHTLSPDGLRFITSRNREISFLNTFPTKPKKITKNQYFKKRITAEVLSISKDRHKIIIKSTFENPFIGEVNCIKIQDYNNSRVFRQFPCPNTFSKEIEDLLTKKKLTYLLNATKESFIDDISSEIQKSTNFPKNPLQILRQITHQDNIDIKKIKLLIDNLTRDNLPSNSALNIIFKYYLSEELNKIKETSIPVDNVIIWEKELKKGMNNFKMFMNGNFPNFKILDINNSLNKYAIKYKDSYHELKQMEDYYNESRLQSFRDNELNKLKEAYPKNWHYLWKRHTKYVEDLPKLISKKKVEITEFKSDFLRYEKAYYLESIEDEKKRTMSKKAKLWTIQTHRSYQLLINSWLKLTRSVIQPLLREILVAHNICLHSSEVLTADFSPNYQNIITAYDDKTIRVWDLDINSSTITVNSLPNLKSITFLPPDGNTFAEFSNEKSTIRIRNSSDGSIVQSVPWQYPTMVYYNKKPYSFSKNAEYLALIGPNLNLIIYDLVESREISIPIELNEFKIDYLLFSATSDKLFISAKNGPVILTDPNKLSDYIFLENSEGDFAKTKTFTFLPGEQRIIRVQNINYFSYDSKIWESKYGKKLGRFSKNLSALKEQPNWDTIKLISNVKKVDLSSTNTVNGSSLFQLKEMKKIYHFAKNKIKEKKYKEADGELLLLSKFSTPNRNGLVNFIQVNVEITRIKINLKKAEDEMEKGDWILARKCLDSYLKEVDSSDLIQGKLIEDNTDPARNEPEVIGLKQRVDKETFNEILFDEHKVLKKRLETFRK